MNYKTFKKEFNKNLLEDLKDKPAIIDYLTELDLVKTNSMFKYNGLPETMERHNIEQILQMHGYGIITEYKDNLYCLWGADAPPLDAYYEPTQIIITNPWLDNFNTTLTYGKDGILIRNDPFKMGLLPILKRYNSYICETDITMLLALVNMRAINIITANSDNEKKSAEEFIKQLFDGNLSVMINEKFSTSENFLNTLPYSNLSNGYITQLIELEQYLRGTKLNEIGLQSNYNMKRERLTASETDLNEDSLKPLVDTMLEERQKAMEEVNKKYGTNITVDLNSSWKDEENVTENEETETEDNENENTGTIS